MHGQKKTLSNAGHILLIRLGKFYNTQIKNLLKAWKNNIDKQNEAKSEYKIGNFLKISKFLSC